MLQSALFSYSRDATGCIALPLQTKENRGSKKYEKFVIATRNSVNVNMKNGLVPSILLCLSYELQRERLVCLHQGR